MTLLSPGFILLALVTTLVVASSRSHGSYLVFLGANLYFASTYLHSQGLVSTTIFILAGYAWARLILSGHRWANYVGPATLTLAFLYMRGYGFIAAILPMGWIKPGLATAGLSFLFFKILHVLVDAASGTLCDFRLKTYVNYCFNFTTFLMGPIQRYQDFHRQWHAREGELPPAFEPHLDAVNRTLRGYVKKFVLAEYLGQYTLKVGADIASMSARRLVVGIYGFYFFLYCDFSGYCDIIIGIGTLMGIRPPENFWLPFYSRNVADFWLRAHKSLTLWLTDYVFNPIYAQALRSRILGSRPLTSMSLALVTTMLVSGLWHGTTFSFFLFGLLHGIYLVIFRIYDHVMSRHLGRERLEAISDHPIGTMLAVFLTFNLTTVAYMFFYLEPEQVVEALGKVISQVMRYAALQV
jgi:D-alanyl-lipoteichoic acid acyltransferase DltB (MBOAT superfamily)